MRNVLIIASFWPYRQGSKRTIGLANYLPEFGWQPIILTPPLHRKPDAQFRVIETPCPDALGVWGRLFRLNPDEDARAQMQKRFGVTSKNFFINFFLTLGGTIINYPDSYKGWKSFAVKAGDELLQNESVDAIISVWPVTSHLIASDLRARYKIPWLADFPDLWSQNHNYSYGPLRKLIDRRLELKTLSKADALVTVSEPWAEKLRALHQGKTVSMSTHGFDPSEVNIPPVSLTSKFTITYTGLVHTEIDPSKLFAALRDLISNATINPNEVEVRFYGPEEGWLAKEVKGYRLSGMVKQYGMVPRQVALGKQKESQLLLLLKWEDPQERGAYSGKIFEYLAARRPILATGGSGDVVSELLNETKAGIDAPTIEDIKDTLQKLYQDYKLRGEIAYNGIGSKINKYSHREMARKFSEVLDHLREGQHGRPLDL